MKYISVDRLSDFEFHDGKLILESFAEHQLTVTAKSLNIHKSAEQNPFDTDMEIAHGRITFRQFSVQSYGSVPPLGADGAATPCVVGDAAWSCFEKQLRSGITVFDLGLWENAVYYLDAIGQDPFFTVRFTFDSVIVEWDGYEKAAWYENRPDL